MGKVAAQLKVGEFEANLLHDLVRVPFSLEATRKEFRRSVEDNDTQAQKDIVQDINQELNALLSPLLLSFQYPVKLNRLFLSLCRFKVLLNDYVTRDTP